MKYSLMDTIVLRSPLLSYELLKDTNTIDNQKVENRVFGEALAMSNSELYKDYINKVGSNIKIEDSIYRYFNRACIRSTPYGLFSGIANAAFFKKTDLIRREPVTSEKNCNVDLGWYYGVINLLEKKRDVIQNTKIKFNDRCYVSGNRIYNPDASVNYINENNENEKKRVCN